VRPSMEMTVSAARTIAGPTARAATSSVFASARRCTCALGDSPEKGVSSTAEERTTKENPAARRISARRVEAEARINFMATNSLGKNTTERLMKQLAEASRRVSEDQS